MRAAVILACLCVATPALADDKADAVALFDEGIRELKAGNFDKACPALEKSLALVKDSGTKGSLAKCYTQIGRVVSAWKLWKDLADTAPKNLRADAAANATKLEPRLPTYIYHLGPGAPRVSATLDGVPIEAPLEVLVPVDPGNHVFEASAAGFVPWKHEFTAVEGKTEDITIPALPTIPQKTEPENPVAGRPPPPPPPKSSRKKIGLAVMAAGGVALIGGAVFGVIAKGRNDDAKDICGGDIDRCDPNRLGDAQDKVDAARSAGNISTVSFVIGGALAAVGGYLFFTAKSQPDYGVAFGVSGDTAGITVSGGF